MMKKVKEYLLLLLIVCICVLTINVLKYSCNASTNYYIIECSNFCNGLQESVLESRNQRIIKKIISNNTIKYIVVIDKENREYLGNNFEDFLDESFMIQKNDFRIINLSNKIMNDCSNDEEYIEAMKGYFNNREWTKNYSIASLFLTKDNEYGVSLRRFDSIEALSLPKLDTLSATNLFIALARAQGIPAKIVLAYDVTNKKYTFWPEVFIKNSWEKINITKNEFSRKAIIIAEGADLLEDIPELTNTPLIKISEIEKDKKLPDYGREKITYRLSSIYKDFYDLETMNSHPQSIINHTNKYIDVSFESERYVNSFDYNILDYDVAVNHEVYVKSTPSININELVDIEMFEEINLESLILKVLQWLRYNITYDFNLSDLYAKGIEKQRTIKEILENKTGVCSDYASLFAAILRREGVPVRIVVGNWLQLDTSGNTVKRTTHVWNEVYSYKDQRWIAIDPQSSSVLLNPSYIKFYSGIDFDEICNGSYNLLIYDLNRTNIESIEWNENKK